MPYMEHLGSVSFPGDDLIFVSPGRLCCVRLLLEAKADANVAKDGTHGRNRRTKKFIGSNGLFSRCW